MVSLQRGETTILTRATSLRYTLTYTTELYFQLVAILIFLNTLVVIFKKLFSRIMRILCLLYFQM